MKATYQLQKTTESHTKRTPPPPPKRIRELITLIIQEILKFLYLNMIKMIMMTNIFDEEEENKRDLYTLFIF